MKRKILCFLFALVSFDGKIFRITSIINNFDLHYNLEEGGTIHFLIDKSTSKLYRIVFTSEM